MRPEAVTQHLDDARYQALLEAPEAHQALVDHLAAGCEVCDAFLATHVDALDGAVDRALMSLAPPAPQPLDEVGWARLKRGLARSVSRRRWTAVGVSLAAALAVVVAGTSLFTPRHPTGRPAWDGVKGSTGGPSLEIAAAQQDGDGFIRLDDGARLTKNAVLVFRAESTIEGPARIYLQRGSSTPVEIGQTEVSSGTHEIRTDTGLLGVSLDGEAGEVQVWVVVGDGPFSDEAAIRAIEVGGTSELGVARVRVNVE